MIYALASAGCEAFTDTTVTCGVFGHFEESRSFYGKTWPGEWRLSDNSDKGWGAIIHHPHDGSWYFRNGYYGDGDRKFETFDDALVAALRMFQAMHGPWDMLENIKKPISAEELQALLSAAQAFDEMLPGFEQGWKALLKRADANVVEQLKSKLSEEDKHLCE